MLATTRTTRPQSQVVRLARVARIHVPAANVLLLKARKKSPDSGNTNRSNQSFEGWRNDVPQRRVHFHANPLAVPAIGNKHGHRTGKRRAPSTGGSTLQGNSPVPRAQARDSALGERPRGDGKREAKGFDWGRDGEEEEKEQQRVRVCS